MDALNFSSFPPGFGFHPTDVELITHYLKNKILGKKFECELIPLVDIYRHEPRDLPAHYTVPTREAKWHFFAYGDKKYPNGTRKNRATLEGYWKSTGKDRIIKHLNRNVGTKKSLVFHEGRPPVGKRTDWIMYEFNINEKEFGFTPEMKDRYVLCCVTYRGSWDAIHGLERTASNSVNIPSNSVNVPSNSVENEEEMNNWINELLDPNFTGSPIRSGLTVETEGSGAITDGNQQAVYFQSATEISEDLDQLFPLEAYFNILESENQNTNVFKDFNILESENQNTNVFEDFNIDTSIFMNQQNDDILSLMDNQEFTSNQEENSSNWTGIQVRQREEAPSSSNATTANTIRYKLQANKMEKICNREHQQRSEFFDVKRATCFSRVLSFRVDSETKVKNTAALKVCRSRQSAFVNCFFMCAFITVVVAFGCYFKMRNARSFVISGLL